MGFKHIAAAAWSFGVLFSPQNLILVGNITGSSGAGIIVQLLLAAFLFWMVAVVYGRLLTTRSGPTTEIELMASVFGRVPAVVLAFSGRTLLAISMATAVLVAAGFVFNEVFVHQFPNFGFAFLLLGTILVIHLGSRRWSEFVQPVLVAIALGGLLVLSISGLFIWLSNPQNAFAPIMGTPVNSIAGIALVFVGFEVMVYARGRSASQALVSEKQLGAVIFLTALVFCLWSMASLAAVDAERLGDTTIPHILAARKIMGQTGRYLMGLVIIAGSAAAVNALFSATAHLIAGAGRNMTSEPMAGKGRRPVSLVFALLAALTAVSMGTGMAGSEKLGTYIRGGLVLWLLNYAGLCLAFSIRLVRTSGAPERVGSLGEIIQYATVSLGLAGAIAALIWTDENSHLIIISITAVIAAMLLLMRLKSGLTRIQRR